MLQRDSLFYSLYSYTVSLGMWQLLLQCYDWLTADTTRKTTLELVQPTVCGTQWRQKEEVPRTFLKPMYSTRPCCLVQAITWHTCSDPHLGSWNCLPHQAHIAPSELMSSIDQQLSSLGSFPTFPSHSSPL